MARSTRHAALVAALLSTRPKRPPELPGVLTARTWYRFGNVAAASGPATLHIYDEIGFWGVSADAFMSDLEAIGGRDLTLRINSPGGEVFDGVAIYNALSRHSGSIDGHVDGLAASAASFIAMACDTLVMEPGAQMMIHDAIGMCYGNEADAIKLAEMLGRTSDVIASIYAERAGGEAVDWRATMRMECWYTGDEAVAAGLADSVGTARDRTSNKIDQRQRYEALRRGEQIDWNPDQPRNPDGTFSADEVDGQEADVDGWAELLTGVMLGTSDGTWDQAVARLVIPQDVSSTADDQKHDPSLALWEA